MNNRKMPVYNITWPIHKFGILLVVAVVLAFTSSLLANANAEKDATYYLTRGIWFGITHTGNGDGVEGPEKATIFAGRKTAYNYALDLETGEYVFTGKTNVHDVSKIGDTYLVRMGKNEKRGFTYVGAGDSMGYCDGWIYSTEDLSGISYSSGITLKP